MQQTLLYFVKNVSTHFWFTNQKSVLLTDRLQKDNSKRYNINLQAILATREHGGGGKDVDTLRSLCNIGGKNQAADSWQKYQFKKCEDVMEMALETITRDSMDTALQEKIKLTLEEEPDQLGGMTYIEWSNLLIDQKKIYRPILVCLYDMGWNQRTSNRYSSPSGRGFLIGARTRKIIRSETLSKICRIYNKYDNEHIPNNTDLNINNITYPEHTCSRNYTG